MIRRDGTADSPILASATAAALRKFSSAEVRQRQRPRTDAAAGGPMPAMMAAATARTAVRLLRIKRRGKVFRRRRADAAKQQQRRKSQGFRRIVEAGSHGMDVRRYIRSGLEEFRQSRRPHFALLTGKPIADGLPLVHYQMFPAPGVYVGETTPTEAIMFVH